MDSSKPTAGASVPLESVLCTEELQRRPSRAPDYRAENRALVALAQALADSPRTILQTLADTILEVLGSESAGVSLIAEGEKRFRWPAIAGVWAPHIGGGTPRDFSPCGDVLDRNTPLLFKHFERRYAYFLPVTPLAQECLLVPFHVEGRAIGTIWAITHDPKARKFDNEDLRMLTSLGRFASAAYQARTSLRASARLAAIVESSDDAIISKDLDGIIQTWNHGAERLFGYSASEAIGRPITLIIPTDRLNEEPGVLERIRRGERIDHYETVRRRKDGTFVEISLSVSPITDTGSQIVGASKIARDITDRRQVEKALRMADRRKDQFLAILAHELRNPLAPISNALEILRLTKGTDETVRSACETMERQVGQIVWFVNDLLDVGRIKRGTFELRKRRIDLANPIDHAVETVRPTCERLGHELTVTLPPEPIYLNADPRRLVQVLSNLLDNACKFTENGGHIWLTVDREDGDAIIRIRDSGIGLAADQLVRIFGMYTQVNMSLERRQAGLGIGLMLVKNLVEMHDGTVEARSAGPGHGSEFVIRLPILVGAPEPTPEATVSEPTPTRSRRFLVVDDNQDSAESLAQLLKLKGNETHTAYDGLEAVAAAETFRPDVVLLDLGLPNLNGFEVARRIRQQPWGKSMVLVAVSGWGQEEDRKKAREAEFNGHLVKPVDHGALMRLLAETGPG